MTPPLDIIGLVKELKTLRESTDANTMFSSESEQFYFACRKHFPAIADRLLELEDKNAELEKHQKEINEALKDVGGTVKMMAMRKAFPDEHKTRTEIQIQHDIEMKRKDYRIKELEKKMLKAVEALEEIVADGPCGTCNKKYDVACDILIQLRSPLP